jgi:hypothetical protein
MDKKVLIAIGAVALAIVAGFVGYSNMPKDGGATISPDDPAMKEIAWIKQKSKEVGGDFKKLSPTDRARVIKQIGQQYAESSFTRYAKMP